MITAQFQPAQPPDAIGHSLLAGASTGLSMVERNNQMRLEQERAQMQREQNAIIAPVIAAKARADLAKANSELEGFTQTEETRRKAHELLPKARADFDAILSQTDPSARAEKALQWASSYEHFQHIGEIGQEFKAKTSLAARLIEDGTALARLREMNQSRERIATIGANSRENIGLPAFEKLRRLRDEAEASGDTEGAAELEAVLLKMRRPPTTNTDADRIRNLLNEAEDAEKSGDVPLATALRNRVQRLTAPRDEATSLREEVLGLLNPPAAKPTQATTPTTTPPATATAPAPVDVNSAIESVRF